MREVRAALGAAIVAGLAVAVAPAIPGALRIPVLVASLALWTAGIGWAVVAGVRTLAKQRPSGFVAIGIAGVAVAILATTELELIRLVGDRPALTWNVDWRYALNHAQAIAHTGGLQSALDYAGAPIDYHVGPAWFAGAVARLFGLGPAPILFGLVPLLCGITFALGAVFLLRGRGVRGPVAVAATGLLMALPGIAATIPLTAYCFLLSSCRVSPVLWTFSHEMMLNSYQGLAVGMAALALLLGPGAGLRQSVLAAGGLASLTMIKPQFFAAYGLIAGLAGIGYLFGVRGFSPRSARVFAAALLAALLGAAFLTLLPHVEGRMGAPTWAPARTGFVFNEDRFVGTMLAVVALLAARRFLREHLAARSLLLVVAGALFALAAFWSVVSFPLPAELVARADMLQMYDQGVDATQRDLAQSLQPLRLLLALLALAALVGSVTLLGRRGERIARATGWAVALSPLMFVAFAVASPLEAYEAAEDVGLLEVLQQVPGDAGLLLSSDLADAAEDYRRPLRAVQLTAYTGRPFYLSNLKYWHYGRSDAHERLTSMRAFFGSPWSAWHAQWLAESGIGGVLVHTRCVPPWFEQPGTPLRTVAHHGRWTALAPTSASLPAGQVRPAWQDLTPAYGQSECLTGALRTLPGGSRSAAHSGNAPDRAARSGL